MQRPPLLEEGKTAEALPVFLPASRPCPTLTCEVQQLQVPALAPQEQRLGVAGAGRGQQLGPQGSRGEVVVPLQHGHQGEALVHQVERELGATGNKTTRSKTQGCD